jgi:hypothetical protein
MDRVVFNPHLKNWYVAFSDARVQMRFQRFLKPGFRHVRAFGFDAAAGVWLLFDPGWDGIIIRAFKNPTHLITEAYAAGPVLYCETKTEIVWKPRFIMACTSQVCHLLGVNLFVHTPWNLFCALKKRGASELLFKD